MSLKKKNEAKEPDEVYQTELKKSAEDLHPVLVKLIEKSKEQYAKGEFISNEEMQRRIKDKIASLK